jgi:hypothetical protein
MQLLTVILVAGLLAISASSQTLYNWIVRGDASLAVLDVDDSGNVLLSSAYRFTLPNATVIAPASVSNLIFKTKPDGTLIWSMRIDEEVQAITHDSSGNIYACGEQTGPIQTYHPNGTASLSATDPDGIANLPSVWIIKFNANGIAQWISRLYAVTNQPYVYGNFC